MSIINTAYFDSQLNRIAASRDCADLTAIGTEMLASLNATIATLTAQITQLAPLTSVPTDLSSAISWITAMIGPIVVSHTNCIAQLADVNTKLTALTAAIAAQQSKLGCS